MAQPTHYPYLTLQNKDYRKGYIVDQYEKLLTNMQPGTHIDP